MTKKEFLKLKKQLSREIEAIEKEALSEGEDINTPEFKDVIFQLEERILKSRGTSKKEYEEFRELEQRNERVADIEVDGLKEENIEIRDSVERIKEGLVKDVDKVKEELTERISKIPKPKQPLSKKDIENIVRPLIPLIPEQKEFKQNKIKELKQDQIDYDFEKKDKEIENLKKEQSQLKEDLNKAIASAGSSGGLTSDKGGRFYNWGMPDKGSYKTAIADDRYALKGEGGTANFVDDETPTGAVNGSNKTFTLNATPSPATSLKIYINGQRIVLTTDYSLSGNTITMEYAYPTGTAIRCDYRY